MKFLKLILAFKPTCFKTKCSAECLRDPIWASRTYTKNQYIELHTYILFLADQVISDCVFEII